MATHRFTKSGARPWRPLPEFPTLSKLKIQTGFLSGYA